MPIEYMTNPQNVAPSAAPLLTFPNGGNWVWSAWQQLIPATPSGGIALTAIVMRVINRDSEVQVGVGPAGSEIVVASFRAPAGAGSDHTNPLPLPVSIEGGERVAMRGRQSAWIFGGQETRGGIIYAEFPIVGNRTTTVSPLRHTSVGATPPFCVTPAAPASWAWTPWVEVATAAADWALLGGYFLSGAINAEGRVTIEVGTGPAGAETPILAYPSRGGLAQYSGRGLQFLANPLVGAVSAGTRVAVRAQGELDAGDQNIQPWLVYHELPL